MMVAMDLASIARCKLLPQGADLVDQLAKHLGAHGGLTAEALGRVERCKTLVSEAGWPRHRSNVRSLSWTRQMPQPGGRASSTGRCPMSAIAWMDHTEADKRRMLAVIDLFREQDTVDELAQLLQEELRIDLAPPVKADR